MKKNRINPPTERHDIVAEARELLESQPSINLQWWGLAFWQASVLSELCPKARTRNRSKHWPVPAAHLLH